MRSRSDLDPQVAVEDVFVDQLRGVPGEGDAAPAEDVGVVGDGQGLVDVLLHDEEGRPVGGHPLEEREDGVDDDGARPIETSSSRITGAPEM